MIEVKQLNSHRLNPVKKTKFSPFLSVSLHPFHRRTGKIITLLTVQVILDEEHVQKM